MLEMDGRRIGYVREFLPPEGYVLNYAVGTTYSLDLGALLGICISSAEYMTEEDPSMANRVKLFAAAAQAKDKITVFCEQGRIANDKHAGELCVLLEGMVEQVVVNRPKGASDKRVSSFHPKVWVIDFFSPSTGKHLYKLFVMSRNLTFDGSWDVAVVLEGEGTGRKVESSENIAKFLRYLASQACPSNRQKIRSLANDISKVSFDVDQRQFEGFEFLPFGPGNTRLLKASESDLLKDKFTNLLVMSPFLGNDGPLSAFTKNLTPGRAGRAILMSRADALEGLDKGLRSKFECYVPNAMLADSYVEEDGLSTQRDGGGESIAAKYSQLHAKLYFAETYQGRTLYLGSMNASNNGVNRNVEALIALKIRKRKTTFREFVNAFIGENAPFEPFVADDGIVAAEPLPEQVAQLEADRLLRVSAKMLVFNSVSVSENSDGTFSLTVDCMVDGFDEGDSILTIAPYLAPEKAQKVASRVFSIQRLRPSQVSEFFILKISYVDGVSASCLVCCPSESFDDSVLDRDSRASALLGRIIQADNHALEEYVRLAFGSSYGGGAGVPGDIGTSGTSKRLISIAPGLYEELLKGMSSKDDMLSNLEVAKHLLEYIPDRYSDGDVDSMKRMVKQFEKAVTAYV